MTSAELHELAARLPGWVGATTVATGALLLAARLLDRALEGRVAASLRTWLYLLVFARLAVPATWTSPLGLLGRAGHALVSAGQPVVLAGATTAAPARAPWLLVVYLGGALLLLGRWVAARRALARALDGAQPAPPWVAAQSRTLVLEHRHLGPLMTGLFQPRIVLPSSLIDAADPETLSCVLGHEAAHVSRRDQWLMALVQLACALAWPILPLWLAAARLRTVIELAADERALAGAPATRRRRYGEVLLALAEDGPPRFAFVPSFGNGLHGRLTALSSWRRWPGAVQIALVSATGAVLFACAAPPDSDRRQHDVAAPAAPAALGLAPPAARPVLAAEPPPKAQVRGSLDKEVIRGVIRQHINEVKACYEAELVNTPRLAGRVITEFTIGTSGQIESAVLFSSTMDSPRVENCVVQAVRTWQFPKPDGGIVIVQYPFVLTPAGG